MKVIIWNNDGEMEHRGNCAEASNGIDYTLCGVTLDGDERTAGTYELKEGKITCPYCVGIILFCKSINRRNLGN